MCPNEYILIRSTDIGIQFIKARSFKKISVMILFEQDGSPSDEKNVSVLYGEVSELPQVVVELLLLLRVLRAHQTYPNLPSVYVLPRKGRKGNILQTWSQSCRNSRMCWNAEMFCTDLFANFCFIYSNLWCVAHLRAKWRQINGREKLVLSTFSHLFCKIWK